VGVGLEQRLEQKLLVILEDLCSRSRPAPSSSQLISPRSSQTATSFFLRTCLLLLVLGWLNVVGLPNLTLPCTGNPSLCALPLLGIPSIASSGQSQVTTDSPILPISPYGPIPLETLRSIALVLLSQGPRSSLCFLFLLLIFTLMARSRVLRMYQDTVNSRLSSINGA